VKRRPHPKALRGPSVAELKLAAKIAAQREREAEQAARSKREWAEFVAIQEALHG
jgi:hypothetical protein